MKNPLVRTLAVTMVTWWATALGHENSAWAAAENFELGVRGALMLSDGTPANDIPGYGLFGRYRVNDRWSLAVALDSTEYDFEQPARILGLQQDPKLEPIDVLAGATTFSLWIERTYRDAGASLWFWGVGLGSASIDVPDARGPLAGSGTFSIQTDAGSEPLVFATGGWRRNLRQRLFIEFALRAEQHLADWKLTDRVSGRTGSVSDYTTYGGHFALGLRF